MKKQIKKVFEKAIESLFTLSGMITGITILLITLFLFSEGVGLFRSPAVEEGYSLYINEKNRARILTTPEINKIFDGEITNWKQLGGDDREIEILRIDDLFALYSEEELGDDYSLLPQRIEETVQRNAALLAFLPRKYVKQKGSCLREIATGNIKAADFFGGKEWVPTASPAPLYGILPLVLGTLVVSLGAILLALPLGLGVAICLSELVGRRTRKWFKFAIELLAGIPSVVYGFWGLVVLVPYVQRIFSLPVGETAFTGSLVLAIMALPTIISVAQDAMSNTPTAMREASLALGATRWQTIYRVVIPYAKSGISAAVVLGVGRAMGETMAVLMVTGNAAIMPNDFFAPVRTIPASIAAELGEVPVSSSHYQALFLLGAILFLFTMLISISAEIISKKQYKATL